jgi:hypothetical protein
LGTRKSSRRHKLNHASACGCHVGVAGAHPRAVCLRGCDAPYSADNNHQ